MTKLSSLLKYNPSCLCVSVWRGGVIYTGAKCIASVLSKKTQLSRVLESFKDGVFFFPPRNVFLLKSKVTSPVCIGNLPLTSVETGLGSIVCCVEKFWKLLCDGVTAS